MVGTQKYKSYICIAYIAGLAGMGVSTGNMQGRPFEVQAQESDSIYRQVYDDYSDILEAYYKLEKAQPVERDYYVRQLVTIIMDEVRKNKLPLYGNFFNRAWREMTAYGANTPLKKFDTTYIKDASGHVLKYAKELKEHTFAYKKMDDLVKSLHAIRQIIRESVWYRYEELLLEKEGLSREITCLKKRLAHEQELRLDLERALKNTNVAK